MSKIIKCILGCMLVFMVCGCSNADEDDVSNFENTDIFKTVSIDCGRNEDYIVVYHIETKVMYVVVRHGRGVGITPLLNPDGTPMLYQGE